MTRRLLFFVLAQSFISINFGDFAFLGLFSIGKCNDVNKPECIAARNELIFRKMTIKENEKNLENKIKACNKNINSQEELLNTLLPFAGKSKGEITVSGCIENTNTYEFIIDSVILVTLLTFQLTQLTSAFSTTLSIPLVAITFEPMYPAIYLDEPLILYSHKASFQAVIHRSGVQKIRSKFNITYAAVLNVREKDSPASTSPVPPCVEDDGRAFCIYYELDKKHSCYKEKYINLKNPSNIQQINSTFNRILEDKRLKFILLSGTSTSIRRFRDIVKKNFKTIDSELFILDFEETVFNKTYLISNISQPLFHEVPGSFALNRFFYFSYRIKHNVFNTESIYRVIKNNVAIRNEVRKALKNELLVDYIFKNWERLPEWIEDNLYEKMKFSLVFKNTLFMLWKERFSPESVSTERLLEQKTFNPKKFLKAQPYCNLTIPEFCLPGFEVVKSFYKENEWNNSYGWNCRLCAQGFYKESNGTSTCKRCFPKNITNKLKTKCYDPYTNIYLNYPSNSYITFIIIAMLQTIIIITMIIFFVKLHDTPIVRTSNTNMSILQLFMHLAIAVVTLFLFGGRPDNIICTARPLFIGIAFSVSVTINISKTQKILTIYNAKLKMSSSQVILTKTSEWMILLVVTLIDVAITIVVMQRNNPSVVFTYVEEKYKREISCNNNTDVLVQFLVAFVLVCFNAIQGMRAHKIPSEYQEILHVIYSSFTSMVILIAAATIYFSQSSEYPRTITMIGTIYLFNLLHFSLIYFYKVFLIIFRPHLNTREAFNKKRAKKMNANFNND